MFRLDKKWHQRTYSHVGKLLVSTQAKKGSQKTRQCGVLTIDQCCVVMGLCLAYLVRISGVLVGLFFGEERENEKYQPEREVSSFFRLYMKDYYLLKICYIQFYLVYPLKASLSSKLQ